MSGNSTIAVLGGGSWATAIIKMLSENVLPGNAINWYMRNVEAIEFIREHDRNPKYLSSVELDNNVLNLSNDINEVIDKSEVLVFAIPSAFLRDALNKITVDLKDKIIVSAIKGIVPADNLIIAEYFNQALPRRRSCVGKIVVYNHCLARFAESRICGQYVGNQVCKNNNFG
jgi:glycerol-3-phosphate dehydrogenase (NAD(P)+)